MTFRNIFSAICLGAVAASASAEVRGEWTIYPTFGAEPRAVVATPSKIYSLMQAEPYEPKYAEYITRDLFLFAYDKQADEMIGYSKTNYLSDDIISCIQYNPIQKYLFIGYANGNIDLLYDDNSVVNIPTLKQASVNTAKTINSVTFDRERNRAYVATAFGFLTIDGENGKVLDSRIYNKSLKAAGRVGDKFIVFDDNNAFWVNDGDKAFSFSDFRVIPDLAKPNFLAPLDGNKFGCLANDAINVCTIDGNSLNVERISVVNPANCVNARDGYMYSNNYQSRLLRLDGSMADYNYIPNAPESRYNIHSSWDGKEFWAMSAFAGLSSLDYNPQTYEWTYTRKSIYPNAPTPYRTSPLTYSPKYGIIANNHGINRQFTGYQVDNPVVTCALENGVWTQYGYPYTKPEWQYTSSNPSGASIDPDNPDVIYYGSYTAGIQRKNLADINDMLILSHPADKSASLPQFQKIAETCTWAGPFLCSFSQPMFDAQGYMYSNFFGGTSNNSIKIYVWTPEDRKAKNFKKYTILEIPDFKLENTNMLLPLKQTKNTLIVSTGHFDNRIIVYDTNGTPTNAADDRKVVISSLIDQDGNKIELNYLVSLFEDPSTGYVWAGTLNGLFYFNPKQVLQGNTRVYRVKVARDDGTNLADYLLNNIPVSAICQDGAGRKWFGTGGGGLVCTSADGRTIEGEVNSSNSDIPSDLIYAMEYNAKNNSIVVSTSKGIGEYHISGGASSSADEGKKAHIYPNPVRPDYLGWVTIDNVPDGGIVKIVDAAGNLVKELGPVESGMVRWDVTNLEMKRVKSGVYNVFASPGQDSAANTVTGKILVVN